MQTANETFLLVNFGSYTSISYKHLNYAHINATSKYLHHKKKTEANIPVCE